MSKYRVSSKRLKHLISFAHGEDRLQMNLCRDLLDSRSEATARWKALNAARAEISRLHAALERIAGMERGTGLCLSVARAALVPAEEKRCPGCGLPVEHCRMTCAGCISSQKLGEEKPTCHNCRWIRARCAEPHRDTYMFTLEKCCRWESAPKPGEGE